MKRTAIISDGKVQNIVMAKAGFKPPKGSIAIESEDVNIGDLHHGEGQFSEPERLQSKEALIAYAQQRKQAMILSGFDFNIAPEGEAPKLVRISLSNLFLRDDIRDLAYLAQEHGVGGKLVLRDQVLDLSAAQIIELRGRLAKHIEHSHAVAASIIAAIKTAHVASKREIDAPETATAIKLLSWRAP